MGTAHSQRSLLDLANLSAQPLETRQAAADAFAASMRRFGIRLSSDELLRQYDLYNDNAGRNADTHVVLGSNPQCARTKGRGRAGQ